MADEQDLKRRLSAIRRRLGKIDPEREALFEERGQIWETLADAGVPQEELATLAGTSRENVKFTLHKRRRSRATAASSAGEG